MSSALSRAASKCIVIGKAAAIGVGVGIALIGALELAAAITKQQWLEEAKDYDDLLPLLGGAIGALAEWIRNRSAWERVAHAQRQRDPPCGGDGGSGKATKTLRIRGK